MHLTQTGDAKSFNELSEELKAKVLDKNREFNTDHSDWYESTEDWFHNILTELGFYNIKSQFSGFWSQGDGASFSAEYSYAKGWKKALKGIVNCDDITQAGESLQEYQVPNRYSAWLSIGTHGMYCHENTMSISRFESDTNTDNEDDFLEVCRGLAQWYYSTLEKEYEYLTSDEAVTESLMCNGYLFDEDGDIV